MGLFLQKTNITRDFLEDFKEGRVFWPKELFIHNNINLPAVFGDKNDNKEFEMLNENVETTEQLGWIKFVTTATGVTDTAATTETKDSDGSTNIASESDTWQHKSDEDRLEQNKEQLMCCLNDMIYDALTHVSGTIDYLTSLDSNNNAKIFQFCAIPQIMAIATIEKCFNNEDVFKTEVKIAKLATVQIIAKCSNMNDVKYWYNYYLDQIYTRIVEKQENTHRNQDFIDLIEKTKAKFNE